MPSYVALCRRLSLKDSGRTYVGPYERQARDAVIGLCWNSLQMRTLASLLNAFSRRQAQLDDLGALEKNLMRYVEYVVNAGPDYGC